MHTPAEVECEEDEREQRDVPRRWASTAKECDTRVLHVKNVESIVHEYAYRPGEEALRGALHGAALAREKPKEEQ